MITMGGAIRTGKRARGGPTYGDIIDGSSQFFCYVVVDDDNEHLFQSLM